MTNKIDCKWTGNMAFEANVGEYILNFDAEDVVGGQNKGARPKMVTLASLAGCTGMDVISILKKMQIIPDYFNIQVEGELTKEHPKYYKKIHLTYQFKGLNIDPEKVEKAINLSQEKYCGVSAMLKNSAEISHHVEYL
jgi:putative redox protein